MQKKSKLNQRRYLFKQTSFHINATAGSHVQVATQHQCPYPQLQVDRPCPIKCRHNKLMSRDLKIEALHCKIAIIFVHTQQPLADSDCHLALTAAGMHGCVPLQVYAPLLQEDGGSLLPNLLTIGSKSVTTTSTSAETTIFAAWIQVLSFQKLLQNCMPVWKILDSRFRKQNSTNIMKI